MTRGGAVTDSAVIRAERAWIDGAFRPVQVRVTDGVISEISEPVGPPRGAARSG